MRIKYFASLRERVGRPEEEIDLPPGVTDVGGLLAWLAARDERLAEALATRGAVRVAVDQEHAEDDAPIGQAREFAFFPPMTGG